MNLIRLSAALSAAMLVSSAAVAQQSSGKCEFEEGRPRQIPIAGLSLSKASSSRDPAERSKGFKEVVKGLADVKENPEARAWYMGQALALWMAEPGMPPNFVVTRATVGLSDNPTQALDLLAYVDSLFGTIETANPACVALTAPWRAQRPWFNLVQRAFGLLSSGDLDSAAFYARRSRVINRASAYGPYVLGQVAIARKDPAGARPMLLEAAKLAGTDTIYKDIRTQALLGVARVAAEEAERATGEEKTVKSKQAIADLRTFLSEVPFDRDAAAARGMLADLLVSAKDTVGVIGVYGDVIANPAKYGDYEKVQAGVTFTRINRTSEATRMFELAVEQNPNQRDALNNLAATYFGLNQFAKVLPVAEKLTKIDPNNPDNWLWFAYGYQGIGKAFTGKDPASVKQRKAYTDSVIKYNEKSEKMLVRLSFTNFNRGSERTELVGQLENRGATEKSYVISFEFLDPQGNVAAAADATVEGVKAKASKEWRLSVPKGNISAFRYKPIE